MTTQTDTRMSQVEALCMQYAQYQVTTDPRQKQAIADDMFFDDPIVWMLYKTTAYAGTPEALPTWGALCHHSLDHDGVCKKRLLFLRAEVARLSGVDILSPAVFVHDLPVSAVADSTFLGSVVENVISMNAWRRYEYEKEGDTVCKWQSFQVG